jgi:hypothetical protein
MRQSLHALLTSLRDTTSSRPHSASAVVALFTPYEAATVEWPVAFHLSGEPLWAAA